MQEHEYENSCRYYDGVFALPPHITRLGATREWLVRHYWGKKIVLLDDDLDFYVRRNPRDWHLTTPSGDNLVRLFWEIDRALDTHAHVGVSGREGNNRVKEDHVECTRYMRLLAYNTALWPENIVCDRLDGMSDFDTNLQLLRAGLPSRVFYRWAQGQKSTQSPGGCEIYRTQETHSAEVAAMCELHPGLITPRYKRNKSGGIFGHRDEVTVAWSMALGWDKRRKSRTPTERMAEELAWYRRNWPLEQRYPSEIAENAEAAA